MRAHRSTERHRIDQRLGRALAALAGVRQHRVGRVPEQRDDALAPERHRVAVEDLVDTHVGGPDVTARTTPQSVATCASESPPDRPGRRARPAPPPARAPLHHRTQSDYPRATHHLRGGTSARITTVASIRRTSPRAVLRAHGHVPLETMHPLAPATG